MRVVVIGCFAIERHGADVATPREGSNVGANGRIGLHRAFAIAVLHEENGFIMKNDERVVFVADHGANNVIFLEIIGVGVNHVGKGALTRLAFLMLFDEHSGVFV